MPFVNIRAMELLNALCPMKCGFKFDLIASVRTMNISIEMYINKFLELEPILQQKLNYKGFTIANLIYKYLQNI